MREKGLGEIEILIVGSYSELIVLRERERVEVSNLLLNIISPYLSIYRSILYKYNHATKVL